MGWSGVLDFEKLSEREERLTAVTIGGWGGLDVDKALYCHLLEECTSRTRYI